VNETTPQQTTQEEKVAAALNEQGFLFSQVVREKIKCDRPGAGQPQRFWRCLTNEYAVTAADGMQTRIDLVLQHVRDPGVFLCVECKRANPLYKQWVFFDRECGPGGTSQTDMYFESFRADLRPLRSNTDALHALERYSSRSPCALFNLYLEVAVDRKNRAGYTETIEDAFLQVTRGQTGFMAKQLTFQGPFYIVAFPVVITTAQLFEARFDIGQVSLSAGTIKPSDVTLVPMEFCAVNYHANDKLAVRSDYAPALTTIENDILFGQTRTVFVVQSNSIILFLNWLNANIVRG
jgi:hypothetical protein